MVKWVEIMTVQKEKTELLFNDLVVREDTCNFRCTYCLSFENTLKTKDDEEHIQYVTVKNERLLYAPGSPLKERLDQVVDQFEEVANAAILRVSGGEILQVHGIFDFFKKKSPLYETIQVLTNGYHLLQPMVENLASLGNVQVHMSIDGHNLDLNGYRVKKQVIQDRLLTNLDRTIRAGIPTEVGSVLTDRNIGSYHTFLDYMLQYEGKVTIYPFPVRGEVKKGMWPTTSAIEVFVKEVVEKYDKYAGILAPKPFLEELCYLLLEGQRRMRCHVPAVMIQSFDDGLITPCPNCWATELGNVLEEKATDVIGRFGKDRIYSIFLWPKPRLPFCKQCYTSFDIVNLFINDNISEHDILKLPLYNRPLTWKRLMKVKEERGQHIGGPVE
jgi:MoaA/NifB/PqqE/SkfB family radical SAM enzyme